jgi:pimeloyl-ACP methyl ester carboxylesterase
MGILSSFLKYYLWKWRNGKKIQKKKMKVDDIELYYETFGDPHGFPLLLLHGGTAFLETFAAQIPFFAKKKDIFVIALDSRAHGRSTDSEKPLSYSLLAEDVKTFIDNLNLEKVNLLGWSDGGVISLHLGMFYPQKINKIVLVGANYHIDGLNETLRRNLDVPNGKDWIDFGATFMYKFLNPEPNPDMFFEKVRLMWLNEPIYTEEQISKIQLPTLIIAGQNEQYIKESHTIKMAKLIPNSKLVIIKDTKHECLIEKPKYTNEIIYNFLK